MRSSLTLRLQRTPDTVAVARNTCRATLTQLGVTDRCVADVALAVTEACANAVEHADDGGEAYELRLDVRDTWLRLEVIDQGVGFDIERTPQSIPGTWSERGRGLGLMQHLVDELVEKANRGAGTRVLLSKRLELEPWSPLAALGERQPIG